MQIKTTDTFKKLGIRYDEKQHLEIKDVVVNSVVPILNVQFTANKLITSDYYSEILEKFIQAFEMKIQLSFTLHDSELQEQDHSTIINHLHLIQKSDVFFVNLDGLKISIEDNKIIYHTNHKFATKMIDTVRERLSAKLQELGLTNFTIDYKMEQEVADLDEIEEVLEIIQPKQEKKAHQLFGNNLEKTKTYPISEIINPDNMLTNPTIEGVVFSAELQDYPTCSLLTIMVVDDSNTTIICKTFTGYNNQPPLRKQLEQVKVGKRIKLNGRKDYDKYVGDDTIEIKSLMLLATDKETKEDKALNKRVEMHLHSKMSKNNGIGAVEDYFKLAEQFRHKSLAITDHATLQGFVEMEKYSKEYTIKPIYGIEANVIDESTIVHYSDERSLYESEYVVFDLETTGLSANYNDLIEIGAVRVKNGMIIDRYQQFIKINHELSEFTTELTGITDEDLAAGKDLKTALEEFYEYSKGRILVAHNALFDLKFLFRNYERELNLFEKQPVLDTLELAKFLHPEKTYYNLKIMAKEYQVALDSKSHHRADYDAEKLTEIFVKMLDVIKENHEIDQLNQLDEINNVNKTYAKHALIYVKNQLGLRDLYQLVSESNTIDFYREARISWTKLNELRTNLIVTSSGCPNSEVINSYLNDNQQEFIQTLSKYDYIEIMPLSQYSQLLESGTFVSQEQVKAMLQEIIKTAKEMNLKIFASGNVHYPREEQYIAKEILLGKDYKPARLKKNEDGVEVPIDKERFKKLIESTHQKNSDQYYKTTEEMLAEFSFLEEAEEYVVQVPNEISDKIEHVQIIPDDLYNPEIEGVDDKLLKIVYENAEKIYGPELPEYVKARIDKELKSIISYGFSVVYYISYKLVKYSLDNGYLVGSRGSVGSSFVATLMNITEVNPLAPHYVCPKCFDFQVVDDGSYSSGYDLPPKICTKCNVQYYQDGQDIPFETFLGFKGDKVPDIDLNFSGDFQAQAHDFVRSKEKLGDDELFDTTHAYRAGTIGTIADKTAYAYARNYLELLNKPARKSDITYFSKDCVGVKRTTGQHPGGIIVIPQHREIYEFTAVQYPADDLNSAWQTTHFDFNAIHDNLLKLDILGHDDPTMLYILQELTGVDPQTIDVTDSKILELFKSTDSIGVDSSELTIDRGTLGIPEFGTPFVMGLLKSTDPSSFAELIQISGLSHGTDVWRGNAEKLIEDNICTLSEVIGCRDDIMTNLMHQGVDASSSFNIMERVRKGKGLTSEDIELLKKEQIPDWYIESCQKIKYLFPKAHASAYVLMALRIAYYKVYYPLEYYAAYFSSRIDDFDVISMMKGTEALKQKLQLLEYSDNDFSEKKKKDLTNSLLVSLEMSLRGYKFIKFDLEKSMNKEFVLNEDKTGLIMPFSIIDGLGEKEAERIIDERSKSPFLTKEDFKKRTRIKKKTFEFLDFFDVFDDLEDNNQISLF